MSSQILSGKVCLVTGGTKGIGKGIALQLGAAGATVYITGRDTTSLKEVAAEIKARGANEVIPLKVDHANDEEVEKLITTIDKEQNGQLDVLVNNVYAAVNYLFQNGGKKFYELDPVKNWDIINGVGLRSHYICSTYATRLMVKRESGLIINITSGGGQQYLFNVAYGVGKCALDRMTADCAIELKSKKVTIIALSPGPARTERVQNQILDNPSAKAASKMLFSHPESTEFSGKAVVHLAADKNVFNKTGQVFLTTTLAKEYNFTDDNA